MFTLCNVWHLRINALRFKEKITKNIRFVNNNSIHKYNTEQ